MDSAEITTEHYLFETQITSPSGKEKWSRDVLNKLLNNYKYTFGIVSHEMFEAVESLNFDAMSKEETPIYEPKMNAFLEHTVYKYLRPTDEPISLTDIARRFEPDNPSYLIQSWLRSRNTIEFLGEWERNNNTKFNEEAFQTLLKDVRSPSYTLTPKRWIETVNAVGLESKRGKNGGTMAHPFIACDFEIWNDMQFRYEVLKYFMSSRVETDDEE